MTLEPPIGSPRAPDASPAREFSLTPGIFPYTAAAFGR